MELWIPYTNLGLEQKRDRQLNLFIILGGGGGGGGSVFLLSIHPTNPCIWFPINTSLRRQFERTWRRTKNPLNRSRLRRQIARCNSLVNKDKSNYYSKLISDNSQDPRKLARTAENPG